MKVSLGRSHHAVVVVGLEQVERVLEYVGERVVGGVEDNLELSLLTLSEEQALHGHQAPLGADTEVVRLHRRVVEAKQQHSGVGRREFRQQSEGPEGQHQEPLFYISQQVLCFASLVMQTNVLNISFLILRHTLGLLTHNKMKSINVTNNLRQTNYTG